jgi:hypothetical protein
MDGSVSRLEWDGSATRVPELAGTKEIPTFLHGHVRYAIGLDGSLKKIDRLTGAFTPVPGAADIDKVVSAEQVYNDDNPHAFHFALTRAGTVMYFADGAAHPWPEVKDVRDIVAAPDRTYALHDNGTITVLEYTTQEDGTPALSSRRITGVAGVARLETGWSEYLVSAVTSDGRLLHLGCIGETCPGGYVTDSGLRGVASLGIGLDGGLEYVLLDTGELKHVVVRLNEDGGAPEIRGQETVLRDVKQVATSLRAYALQKDGTVWALSRSDRPPVEVTAAKKADRISCDANSCFASYD